MATSYSNPGFSDRFTCPACLLDHYGDPSTITSCNECGKALTCEVESQPVAVCRLTKPEDQNDG